MGVMRRDAKFELITSTLDCLYMNLSKVVITARNPILVLESLKNAKISHDHPHFCVHESQ